VPGREISPLIIRSHNSILGVRNAPLEFPDALSNGRPYLWQSFGSEEQQDDDHDHQDFPHAEISHLVPLEKRTRDQIRHQDSDQAEHRHVEPNRT
jgi:hypothetical protein